jgi:hypothetical protein
LISRYATRALYHWNVRKVDIHAHDSAAAHADQMAAGVETSRVAR